MNNNTKPIGSECITNGFKVVVEPIEVDPTQININAKYCFAYTITIKNESEQWAKLLSRRWLIINADGNKEEVIGDGVVGYSPEFNPGTSFTYTSYCPLDTNWGTMEGHFEMLNAEGEKFFIEVKRFFLVSSVLDNEI